MHGVAVYLKEVLSFAWELFLENSANYYLCFQLALLDSASYFFFLIRSPSLSLWAVFGAISSNINKVLSINPSANVCVLRYFDIHHKDWLTYFGGTDGPGELSNDLTQMVNFLTWIPGCDFPSPALLDLFFSSKTSICFTMAFPPLGNSDHVFVSVSIDFPSNSKQDALFHHIVCDYSCSDWYSPCDHLRDIPWKNIFRLSISAAASTFCECV